MESTDYQQISKVRISSTAKTHHPYDVAIGERLKDARIKAKLTQKEVADLLFLQQGHISEYENGLMGLKVRDLKRWTDALERNILDIIL